MLNNEKNLIYNIIEVNNKISFLTYFFLEHII